MEDSKKHFNEYKNLFNNMPDPGGLLDEKGNFLLVTKAFEGLMGVKEKDLIGKNAFKIGFFNKDYEKIAFNNMKTWLANKAIPAHDIILNVKGGKIIIAQTKNSVVDYRNKKAFLFFLRDVTEQRKAEKLLSQSETKFREILTSTSDMAWEVNNEGRIEFISGKVKELLGYEPKELIGRKIYEVMPREEKSKSQKIFRQHLAKRENIRDFENIFIAKNGVEKFFQTNGIPVLDNNDKLIGYRGVEKDITDRKRSEERFRELFDNMKSGVVVFDVFKGGKEITFKDLNKAAEKIDGIKKESALGKSIVSVFPRAKEEGIIDAITRVWNKKNTEYFSMVLNKNTDKESWRDNFIYKLSSGEVVLIYDDVTEKIKSDRLTEENESKFRKIFEASPEAIVILNSKSQVVDLNERMLDWLAYDRTEIIGKGLMEFPFFSKESKMAVMNKFKEKMMNPQKILPPYEAEFIGKTGTTVIGRIYSRVIQGIKGGDTHDLVMIADVTKENEAEKLKKERQEQLEKMNRLMVGRELKMIELKDKIKKLEEKLRDKIKR